MEKETEISKRLDLLSEHNTEMDKTNINIDLARGGSLT
jgi:hypothetical protein